MVQMLVWKFAKNENILNYIPPWIESLQLLVIDDIFDS